MKIFRVVVRGQFDGLDEQTKATLLADAEAHDYLHSAFTKDGTFTYDERLIAFNLRYEVRVGPEVPDDVERVVEVESLIRAAQWLSASGYPHKKLSFSATDMSSIWDDED